MAEGSITLARLQSPAFSLPLPTARPLAIVRLSLPPAFVVSPTAAAHPRPLCVSSSGRRVRPRVRQRAYGNAPIPFGRDAS
jgi:hypothetical protein